MLQSHNDTAVAIAERIGGSTEGFAAMMNQKAEELGCTDTHFVTPNGLDAKDSGGIHHTTARDLARIMRYAIQNPMFLKITQTREYSFSDIQKKRTFSIHNTNAFLDMREGIVSGKQDIQEMQDTVMCVQKKEMEKPLSLLFWGADGRTIRPINGRMRLHFLHTEKKL